MVVTKVSKFFAVIMLCFSSFYTSAESVDDQKSGDALRYIINTNPEIKQQFEEALNAMDEKSYWHGKTVNDFYNMVNEWQYFIPLPSSISQYNRLIADFVESPAGYRFMEIPYIRAWFKDFLDKRKAFLDTPESAKNMKDFMQDPNFTLSDFVVPDGGFKSFNQFFTRKLKAGVRDIEHKNNDSYLVSPVDATYNKADSIYPDHKLKSIHLKSDRLSTMEVFNNSKYAEKLVGGVVFNSWLDYYNAHWLYSPVDGEIVDENVLGGLYNLEDSNLDLPQHKRGYFIIKTKKFGYVGLVGVGLQTVSEINLLKEKGTHIKKGDVLANFSYGGSTMILFFQKDTKLDFLIPVDKKTYPIRIGQPLLRLK